MSLKIKLELTDIPRIERKTSELAAIPARLGSTERRKISDRIRLGFQHAFTSEGFGQWPPLAPGTVAERRRLGGLWGVSGEHPILKRTGSYRSSWVDRSDRNHWEQWGSFAGMTVVTVGSAHWLTEYHEEGAGVMPARRVVVLSEEDLAGIGDTCAYVFREKFRRGG